jgi:hypothetical protein
MGCAFAKVSARLFEGEFMRRVELFSEVTRTSRSYQGSGRGRIEEWPGMPASRSLSFRLSGSLLEILLERADSLSLSPSAYARQLVVAALRDEAQLEIRRELLASRQVAASLSGSMRDLRGAVRSALEVILLNVVEEGSREEIEQWVDEHFGHPERSGEEEGRNAQHREDG